MTLKRLSAGVVVALLLLTFCAACASKHKTGAEGEYVDDAAITAKVQEVIAKDPALKIRQLKVETFKGVVQLNGFIDNGEEARRASNIAAEVAGVVSVKNDLIVK